MKTRILVMLMMVGLFAVTVPGMVMSEVAQAEQTASERARSIAKNCESIRETLISVQHSDSRARVYLGRYYETMLSSFITPLNVWLVGRNASNAKLIENQNSFAETRGDFVANYIAYQKELEELVTVNCQAEPERFDEKLASVRKARAKVAGNVSKLRKLMDEQVKLVKDLKGTL